MNNNFSTQKFLGALAEKLITNCDRACRPTTPGLIGGPNESEAGPSHY